MKSIRTYADSRVKTVFSGTKTGDGWVQVPDNEYIHPRDAPAGYDQIEYLKPSTTDFDAETASMGAVRRARVSINSPETIKNDGSEAEVVFNAQPADSVSANITIDDLTEPATISGERTETIKTTVPAGNTITVAVGGEGVARAATEIEVVQP